MFSRLYLPPFHASLHNNHRLTYGFISEFLIVQTLPFIYFLRPSSYILLMSNDIHTQDLLVSDPPILFQRLIHYVCIRFIFRFSSPQPHPPHVCIIEVKTDTFSLRLVYLSLIMFDE